MIPAQIDLKIDDELIRKELNRKLDAAIHEHLLLIDVEGLAKKLSMSKRYIEDEFLRDPRVRQHEVRKNRKKWFFYEPTIHAITEIIKTEW